MLPVVLFLLQAIDSGTTRRVPRPVAIDERLAQDLGLAVGDAVRLRRDPGSSADAGVIAAIFARGADPSEVARGEYHVRMHLPDLQDLIAYGDRVDRFAIQSRGRPVRLAARVNAAAFGFRAYPSREIAVQTSRTFAVVSRFHSAIGVITIVASAIFLLCIMLLKVEERRRDVAALRLLGISSRTIVQSVMIESALIAVLGSGAGIGLGAAISAIVNWHYQGVYRTPLVFSLVTPPIVGLAVGLSVALGLIAGYVAAKRLVAQRPLALIGR